jgi:cytochrome P450
MVEPTIDVEDDILLTRPHFWTAPGRHAAYAELRDRPGITFHPEVPAPWAPEGGAGYWAVMRYDEVVEVTRNPQIYSTAKGTQSEDWPEDRIKALGMLHMDDPDHRIWRSIVGPAFAPRNLDRLIDQIRVIADDVIDALLAEPDVDVVTNLVNSYPVRVIASMVETPDEDAAKFVEWTYLSFGADREKANAAHRAQIEYGIAHAAKFRENPGDGVMGRILTAEVDGRRLTDFEIGGFISLLIGAGSETTGSTLATGLWELAKNPDQWQLLKDDPSLIGKAVDEFLRYTSAVVQWRRTATQDTELSGQHITAGDKVVMFYESANFDESVFPDPERFDITRDASKQVSFGAGGPHQCLGEHLARREMRVFLEQLIKRVDTFEITADLRRPPVPRFNMIHQFRATFTPNP